jgi:hypothetical protein
MSNIQEDMQVYRKFMCLLISCKRWIKEEETIRINSIPLKDEIL